MNFCIIWCILVCIFIWHSHDLSLFLSLQIKHSLFCRRILSSNYFETNYQIIRNKSSHWRCSVEKGVLRNFAKFTGKHLCQGPFFSRSEAGNFIKKEIVAQVFSCKFCEISKNTFSTEYLGTTASAENKTNNQKTSTNVFHTRCQKLRTFSCHPR